MDFKRFLFLMICAFLGVHIFFSCDDTKTTDPRFSEGVVNMELFEDIDTSMQVAPNPTKPEDREPLFDKSTPRFTYSTTDMLDSYVSIGFSLYYDDTKGTLGGTTLLLSYLGMTENLFQNDETFTEGVSDEKQEKWEELRDKIFVLTMRIKNATGDIELQRKRYNLLTDVILDLLNEYGMNGPTGVNLFYCQKALNGQGAYWLNRIENTMYMNPYFAMVTDSTQTFDSCMVNLKTIKFE